MRHRFPTLLPILAVQTIVAACMVAPARADIGQRLLDQAAEQAVSQAFDSLSKANLGKIERVAIVPMANDKGGIVTDCVSRAITKTRLKLVLSKDLVAKIILPTVEGALEIDDLMDESTRKELRLKHVDGLLFGWVKEATVEEPTGVGIGKKAIARVSLKLANIETGEVPWSEVGEGTAEEVPNKTPLVIAVLVALAIAALILGALFRGRERKAAAVETETARHESVDTRMEKDQALRRRMAEEIGKAQMYLREAQSSAQSASKSELVGTVKNTVDAVESLRSDVDGAAMGDPRAFKTGKLPDEALEKLVALDTMIDGLLDEITDTARKTSGSAADDEAACKAQLAQVKNLALQMREKVSDRKGLLDGLVS